MSSSRDVEEVIRDVHVGNFPRVPWNFPRVCLRSTRSGMGIHDDVAVRLLGDRASSFPCLFWCFGRVLVCSMGQCTYLRCLLVSCDARGSTGYDRFIYLLFGRRRMLPVALTWQRIMTTEIFIKTIDAAMGYLFSWKASQVRATGSCRLCVAICVVLGLSCLETFRQQESV